MIITKQSNSDLYKISSCACNKQLVNTQDGELIWNENSGYCWEFEEPAPHIVEGWLKVYYSPQIKDDCNVIDIPRLEPDVYNEGTESEYSYNYNLFNKWYTFENKYVKDGTFINPWVDDVLGYTPTVNINEPGAYTDENGNYWIAIGPMVFNQNQSLTEEIDGSKIYGKGTLDVKLLNAAGNACYVRCIPGDVKAHTYPNGIIQTWKTFLDNHNGQAAGTLYAYAPKYNWNEVVCIEFIGPLSGKLDGLSDYTINKLLVYPNQ